MSPIRFLRELWDDSKLLFSLFAFSLAVFGAMALLVVDHLTASTITTAGTVITRTHEAAQLHQGTGYGVGSDGKPGMVSTTSHRAEQWLVIVRTDDGDVCSASIEPKEWALVVAGDSIWVDRYVGSVLGLTHSRKARRKETP